MTRQVLVESIRIDGETQSRAAINEETVAEYAEAMKGGAKLPPLTVFFDGTEYWPADGFHRLLAAKRIGRKNILADVKKGSREDAAWAACAANQTHGLRRTQADKRKAVEIALRLRPEKSARVIADHCGVADHLVAEVRSRCVIHAPGHVVGKDGKNYPVPPPRAKVTAAQSLGPPPRPEERPPSQGLQRDCASLGGLAASHGPPPSAAERPAERSGSRQADGLVDDVGRRIPDHLLPLWGRRQEVQDMLTALSRVRVALREAQDNGDPLFSECPFSSALAHLDQAYDAVQVAKPYAVCAFCQGHGCKACGQRGLLGKFRWDTTVPKEHKEAVARLVEKEKGKAEG